LHQRPQRGHRDRVAPAGLPRRRDHRADPARGHRRAPGSRGAGRIHHPGGAGAQPRGRCRGAPALHGRALPGGAAGDHRGGNSLMARVIDVTSPSGAYGTRLLAEAGHDVVRVEPPGGDTVRRLGPFLGDTPDLERGAFHQFWNAGKRSLSLNLDAADSRALLLELAERCDALVATLPLPGAGAEVRARDPALGLPQVEDAGPELCAVARSGIMSLVGRPDGPPMLVGGHIAYSVSGLYVGLATALGLLHRQLAGQGSTTTVSVLECLE